MTQATVLVIDDEPLNVSVMSRLLRPAYRVRAATSGSDGLLAAARPPRPDLILLDIAMPGLDGYAVLARLRADSELGEIPVIFVTALADAPDEERGLALGACDYITKPIRPAVVMARVRAHLEVKRARDYMRNHQAYLEGEVARRVAEAERNQIVSIRALARLAEIRDPETGNHILRTQFVVHELALRLRALERFSRRLDNQTIDLLTQSAPLHDIGKVGIPDHILLKPGRLDPGEWAIMKTHCRLGAEALEAAERDAERPVPFLALAKEIARSHHERWDGSGYPDNLAGEAIPLSARIMTVADVFDALISPRVYRPGMSVQEVHQLMTAGRGTQFDPEICEVFLAGFDDFLAISARYEDAWPPASELPLPRVASEVG